MTTEEKMVQAIAVCIGLAMLAGLALAGVGIYFLVHLNKRVVPDVVGVTSGQAVTLLEDSGLHHVDTWGCLINNNTVTRVAMKDSSSFLGGPNSVSLSAFDRVYVGSRIMLVCGDTT